MHRQVARMDRVVCPAEEVTSYSDASPSTCVQSLPTLDWLCGSPVLLFSSLFQYVSTKSQLHPT